MPSNTIKIRTVVQTDLKDENKPQEHKAAVPEQRTYPINGYDLDPSLLLIDPPACVPVADRRTAIVIYPNGKVTLGTDDPNVVRPIAKAISQGKESWKPIGINGEKGHQTGWVLQGDLSLISIRSSKFKRPGVVKNLKKKAKE